MLDELAPCCVLQTFYEAFVALSFTGFPLYFRAVLCFSFFFFSGFKYLCNTVCRLWTFCPWGSMNEVAQQLNAGDRSKGQWPKAISPSLLHLLGVVAVSPQGV